MTEQDKDFFKAGGIIVVGIVVSVNLALASIYFWTTVVGWTP